MQHQAAKPWSLLSLRRALAEQRSGFSTRGGSTSRYYPCLLQNVLILECKQDSVQVSVMQAASSFG